METEDEGSRGHGEVTGHPLTSGSPSCYCPGPGTGGRGGAGWPARLRAGRRQGEAPRELRGRPAGGCVLLGPGAAGGWERRARTRRLSRPALPYGTTRPRHPSPPGRHNPGARARGPRPRSAPRRPARRRRPAHSRSPAECCPRRGPAPRASRRSPWRAARTGTLCPPAQRGRRVPRAEGHRPGGAPSSCTPAARLPPTRRKEGNALSGGQRAARSAAAAGPGARSARERLGEAGRGRSRPPSGSCPPPLPARVPTLGPAVRPPPAGPALPAPGSRVPASKAGGPDLLPLRTEHRPFREGERSQRVGPGPKGPAGALPRQEGQRERGQGLPKRGGRGGPEAQSGRWVEWKERCIWALGLQPS